VILLDWAKAINQRSARNGLQKKYTWQQINNTAIGCLTRALQKSINYIKIKLVFVKKLLNANSEREPNRNGTISLGESLGVFYY
jgi:hypothetical protein